jgi:Na+/melibiose symporter-like transporter
MKNSASFFSFFPFVSYFGFSCFFVFFGVSWLIWCAILTAERKQGEEEQDVESEKMFMLCCERRR